MAVMVQTEGLTEKTAFRVSLFYIDCPRLVDQNGRAAFSPSGDKKTLLFSYEKGSRPSPTTVEPRKSDSRTTMFTAGFPDLLITAARTVRVWRSDPECCTGDPAMGAGTLHGAGAPSIGSWRRGGVAFVSGQRPFQQRWSNHGGDHHHHYDG